MKARIRVLGAGALLLLVSGAFAQRDRWEYLGEANVDGAADHDRITVTRREGTFRAIQLRVQKASIKFDRVIVHYGNGSSEPIPIRALIEAGGQTRVIDLPGERRVINSVEFFYERAGFRRGKVRLWGIR